MRGVFGVLTPRCERQVQANMGGGMSHVWLDSASPKPPLFPSPLPLTAFVGPKLRIT